MLSWALAVQPPGRADELSVTFLDGFTEPDQTIQVAMADTGVVDAILVEKGERVTAGQPLARLNTRVLDASLSVATARANSTSAVKETWVLWDHEARRVKMLEDLLEQGHANSEEVHLARTKEQTAAARLATARHQRAIYRLEQKQIEMQIAARQLSSPIAGVIADIHRQPGEFVSANDPAIVTLVRLDLLRVKFFVPAKQALLLTDGQRVQVLFAFNQKEESAVVDFISPLVDASSMTVQVEAVIDNANNLYRSGQRCQLKLDSVARSTARVSQK
ncbi:MAG: efflux RND transporter periplasmic adaptor subunit [Pirellulales bacterium]|nr:efflux RND transporter periplasmic adaptor subunit [Pirellulales bacterium]